MITGYGTDEATGLEYWHIRNTVGTDWGENGYIRLTGGADTCGVLDYAVVPTV